MSRTGRLIGLGVLAAIFVAAVPVVDFARKAGPTGVGLAAKHLCSLHFVSGLPIEQARALYVDPFVQPLTRWMEVTTAGGDTLTARALGWESVARHREGYGCTLVFGDGELQPARAIPAPVAPDPVDEEARERRYDARALTAALDAVFENPEGQRNTLAVAIYDHDRLVAERYAEGLDATTALPGWSMTKSVTATLAGIAVAQGRLDPDAPGVLPEWADSDDPRAAITLDHLLRMTSGMNLVETQTGADVNSRLLFGEADGAAFGAGQPLLYDVGSTFDYMSGSTVLASRAIRDAIDGTLAGSYDWIEQVLFEPLGMSTARLEPDQAGTFVGSSYMLASAQDWAKLGRLYARGGDWEGRQLLPLEWIERILTPTPQSGPWAYGAGFWLNRSAEGSPRPTLPEDTFAMDGFQGQFVFVVPSAQLVVVRLGATSGVSDGTPELVRAVLAARRATNAATPSP